ncbi:sorbose reductase [Thalassotalea insulae]|uniref:Chaperone NapD n=1 Tax=Thalassotalea insulae TaxID=2056778 RepID=A0ABQ6GVD0_9GAMM|nr:chaperone NapD [Thalassotalea insulae]GLX79649.1 sorbose reductase [Thalassotalea insulae]
MPEQRYAETANEYHVASFVAHAQPQYIKQLTADIKNSEGAEIHAISDEGKIVFTIEAPSQKKIAMLIDQLKHHIGLFSLSPVYHQFLTEEQSAESKEVNI